MSSQTRSELANFLLALALAILLPSCGQDKPSPYQGYVEGEFVRFRDLQVGDYVVHVEHGIGQYQGLKEINQGDGNAEFMLLEYADGARRACLPIGAGNDA